MAMSGLLSSLISAMTVELPTPPLQAALAISITNGTFTDTAYVLFSSRGAHGRVGSPKATYASSTVLKAAGERLAASEWAIILAITVDGSPAAGFENAASVKDKIPDDTDEYGYEADSDLDECEDSDWKLDEDSEDSTEASEGKVRTL